MSGWLVLPDPRREPVAAVAERCAVVWERRDLLIGVLDLPTAAELRRQAAAIEEYLRGTEAYPEGQRAARVLEMAVGAALGEPSANGKGPRGLPAGNPIEPTLRHEFRAMARGRAAIERYLAAGGMSREACLRIARTPTPGERRASAQAADRAARAIAPGSGTDSGPGWAVHCASVSDAPIADSSVSLIVTDPPYPQEFAGVWDDLAAFAARVLVPGGIVLAMSGKIHLPERMAALGARLSYGWVYAQELPGSNTRVLGRHAIQEWKPWLAYSRGQWPSGRLGWHGDLLVAAPRDKTAYHWQQSVEPAEALVRSLCPPGGLVCDPFLGSGSYGVAAIRAGREFVGVEIDAARASAAAERLASEAAEAPRG